MAYSKNIYGIIIQARDSSSRLKNKMTRRFYKEKSILDIIIERLVNHYDKLPIVLATTTSSEDDPLVQKAEKNKIFVFRGDKENVLKRMIDAAKVYSINNIIRVCADNPFLDMMNIDRLIENHKKNPVDYMSFNIGDGSPSILSHYGFFSEIAKKESLEKIQCLTDDPFYLEHVTNYLYSQVGVFKIALIPIPEFLNDRNYIRLTVDTEEDFQLAKSLYSIMLEKQWNLENLVRFIESDQNIKDMMLKMIKKNAK